MATANVRQFLGVPYASAGRWEAPTLPLNRTTIFKATKFSDACVQNLAPSNLEFLKLSGGQGIGIPESEDCLTANIWVPSLNRKQKTAVLIWIHGGGFQWGTLILSPKSNLAIYNGQNFVRDNDDIAIVTFNYRLNVFGQPNAPQLLSKTKSQNFGLLDIDAAIQWVHTNIAAFGGDPERISLFGQSAGSMAVDAYSFMHPNDTIVKGTIQMSGTLIQGDSPGGLANATYEGDIWNSLAESLNCGNGKSKFNTQTFTKLLPILDPDDAQLACMKAVPFRTLEDAVMKFGAIVFKAFIDDITLFTDLPQRIASGKFLKVPLLSGSVLNENDIFVVAAELTTPPSIVFPLLTEVAADLQTQVAFTCPAGTNAQDRLNVNLPVWRYQYQAVFSDLSTRPELRSYHQAEVPIVFGTYDTAISAVKSTTTEVNLSKYMQKAWVAFARDPANGLTNYGWPTYNATSDSLVQLGGPANPSGLSLGQGSLLDHTCNHSDELLTFAIQLSSNFA
ncbi:Cholinesterase [Psilocybe cubensis]|uniref:Cholinesterase n=1 Tax=Psilocybe cubensis TaxID=181762 RepID=A0ACB8HET4_PSICU|nr:Cholinesterase [Psilocybe cubensis]KAH9485674.1 Cholinesterase [Psilocybe cubensis]